MEKHRESFVKSEKVLKTTKDHEVKINIEFNPLSSLLIQTAGSGGGPVTVAGGSMGYSSLYVDYVYLDTDERRRFAQVSHEYLIEQLQFTGGESVSGMSNKIRLNFNHPVKELLWVVATDANVSANKLSTYTVTDVNGREVNPIVDAKLQLNGHDRFSTRGGSYFNLVQPYQHHSNIPRSRGINVYSFGLKPEEHQPSGTCNFSRIDNATLNLSMVPNLGSATVNIYAINYNVSLLNALKSCPVRVNERCSHIKSVRHSYETSTASKVNTALQNTLLFGKPLRAFYTKHDSERIVWRRTNSGTVIVRKIGQSACLLPKPDASGTVGRQRLNGCWSSLQKDGLRYSPDLGRKILDNLIEDHEWNG